MSKGTKTSLWAGVEAAIEAGEFPTVFVDGNGQIRLADGAKGPALPKRLASRYPAEIQNEAAEKAAAASRARNSAGREVEARYERAAEDRRAAWLAETAHFSHFAIWLNTGAVDDCVTRRMPGVSGEMEVARGDLKSAVDWNRFRETDARTCGSLGYITVSPIGENGEVVSDLMISAGLLLG